MRLSEGANALRNDTLRSAIVADARNRAVMDSVTVTSEMQGNTLVVSYWTNEGTEREVGVLLFTAFHASDPLLPFVMGGEGTVYLGADELTIRGPPSSIVVGEYDSAHSSGNVIRWTGSETSFDRATVVAFVSEDATFPAVRVTLARLLH